MSLKLAFKSIAYAIANTVLLFRVKTRWQKGYIWLGFVVLVVSKWSLYY